MTSARKRWTGRKCGKISKPRGNKTKSLANARKHRTGGKRGKTRSGKHAKLRDPNDDWLCFFSAKTPISVTVCCTVCLNQLHIAQPVQNRRNLYTVAFWKSVTNSSFCLVFQQLRHNQQQISVLQNEVDTLRSDNVKLYEKIKFLQSYPTKVTFHQPLRNLSWNSVKSNVIWS